MRDTKTVKSGVSVRPRGVQRSQRVVGTQANKQEGAPQPEGWGSLWRDRGSRREGCQGGEGPERKTHMKKTRAGP